MENNSFLTLIQAVPKKNGRKMNLYLCICGRTKIIFEQNVKRGNTTSCGCRQKQIASASNSKHGLRKHPLYQVWHNMIRRCYDPKATHFDKYGGRGISVCTDWRNNFINFYDWSMANGWKHGLQLDKDLKAYKNGEIPNIYSPEMCQFVTPKINSNNRRNNKFIEHKGDKKTVAQWANEYNIHPSTLLSRIKNNWDFDQALLTSSKYYHHA